MFPVKQRHDRAYPVRPRVWPFLAWAVVGAGLCIALLTALTIGIFVLPVTLGGMAALLLWRGSRNGSAFGLPAGAGTVPLYVSYLNRGGPGNVCATAGTGQSCISEWSPWPWLAAALLLVAAGAGLFLWLRHEASRREQGAAAMRPR
jgi:hypothetical protein